MRRVQKYVQRLMEVVERDKDIIWRGFNETETKLLERRTVKPD